MASVIGIDHLVIRVGDFAKSKRFYKKVLGLLGFKLKYEFGDAAGWSNGKTLFWIGAADAEGKRHPHRSGNIGFHHYAFELGRRQDVDELYSLLQRHEGDRRRSAGGLPALRRRLLRRVLSRPRRAEARGHGLSAGEEEAQTAGGPAAVVGVRA